MIAETINLVYLQPTITIQLAAMTMIIAKGQGGMKLRRSIYVLPSKVDLFMEEEEINDGYHNLHHGDEGCGEDRALVLHAPRHYQVHGSRTDYPLHI